MTFADIQKRGIHKFNGFASQHLTNDLLDELYNDYLYDEGVSAKDLIKWAYEQGYDHGKDDAREGLA